MYNEEGDAEKLILYIYKCVSKHRMKLAIDTKYLHFTIIAGT